MATAVSSDAYNRVVNVLKQQESTRAELKRLCDLPYHDVEKVLYELNVANEITQRTDPSGIDYFKWIGNRFGSVKAPAEKKQPPVIDEDNRKTPSTLGVSITDEVRLFIKKRPFDQQFTSSMIRDAILATHPILLTCDVPQNVVTAISATLSTLCAKREIAFVEKGKGGQPSTYVKLKTPEDNHKQTMQSGLEDAGIETEPTVIFRKKKSARKPSMKRTKRVGKKLYQPKTRGQIYQECIDDMKERQDKYTAAIDALEALLALD